MRPVKCPNTTPKGKVNPNLVDLSNKHITSPPACYGTKSSSLPAVASASPAKPPSYTRRKSEDTPKIDADKSVAKGQKTAHLSPNPESKPSPQSRSFGLSSLPASSSGSSLASAFPSPSIKPRQSESLTVSPKLLASVGPSSGPAADKPSSSSLFNPNVQPQHTSSIPPLLLTANLGVQKDPSLGTKGAPKPNHAAATTVPPLNEGSVVLKLSSDAPKPSNETKPVLDAMGSANKTSPDIKTSKRRASLIFSSPTPTPFSEVKEKKETSENRRIDVFPESNDVIILHAKGGEITIVCPIPQKQKLKIVGGDLYLEADMGNDVCIEVTDGNLFCDNIGAFCRVTAKEIDCDNVGVYSELVSTTGSIRAKNIGAYVNIQAIDGDVFAETVPHQTRIWLKPDHLVYAKSINPISVKRGRLYTIEDLTNILDCIQIETEHRNANPKQ